MKVRVKFRKYGIMRFIGHLDLMRYFQKAIRRADIDIRYSEGFSPHMIMSFAMPLGVGLTSDGEYMDIEVKSAVSSADTVSRLNAVMTEGVDVLSAVKIPEGRSSNAMSLVAAADYEARPAGERSDARDLVSVSGISGKWDEFLAQESIQVVKKTKKGERMLDLKPLIFESECRGDRIFMRLSAGSAENVRPELVTDAFADFAGFGSVGRALSFHRLEMYADLSGDGEERRLVSLESLGEEF